MKAITGLYRRSRSFRIASYLLLATLWAFVAFVSINSFAAYTEVGDVTVLTLVMLFALWAWWYGEDRDRRRGAKVGEANGDGQPPAV
jgi:hypothetical protein